MLSTSYMLRKTKQCLTCMLLLGIECKITSFFSHSLLGVGLPTAIQASVTVSCQGFLTICPKDDILAGTIEKIR